MIKERHIKAIIAGLGNPGLQHAMSRHNVGFMAIDRVMGRHCRFPFEAGLGHGGYVTAIFDEAPTVCVKPMAGMGFSGDPMLRMAESFPEASILVVYDEMELPFGTMKVIKPGIEKRACHTSPEHDGIRSVERRIGADSFTRIPIGIGKPMGGPIKWLDHLFGSFSREEVSALPDILAAVEIEILDWLGGVIGTSLRTCRAAKP